MNLAVLSGVFGAMVVAGLVGSGWALVGRASGEPVRRTPWQPLGLTRRLARRTVLQLAASIAVGLVLAVVTGWLVAVLIVPAAVLGLPYLLSDPPAAATIRRLEAMEEWTRSLAGVLGAGVGLEQAIGATLRSTPEAIRPEVARLVARLRARWDTEVALRAFADDLDDVTGDLIAANLILAARRRSRSLAGTLQAVAESVSEDVASRRRVEAGRAKPRGSARLVTMFSAGVLVVLAFTGDYVAPYRTPLGQLLLVVLLAAYAAGLAWMRKMAEAKPPPRIVGAAARAGAS
ncbi:MAG: type II secretion system F family protein [Actinomycetales bacterium]|nr:type II secretion system F family protein [Actinomycetales bacterium]